jgi:hypothetical protein
MITEKQISSFLSAACAELGYCLPKNKQKEIIYQSPLSAKELIAAVLIAEGIEAVVPELHPHYKPMLRI